MGPSGNGDFKLLLSFQLISIKFHHDNIVYLILYSSFIIIIQPNLVSSEKIGHAEREGPYFKAVCL